MSVIVVKLQVQDITQAMSVFTHFKVYRSTDGETGTYTEITTPLTRPALVSGQVLYLYEDLTGDADYYYKSSYYHNVSGLESSLSDAQQGEGDAALDILSIQELQDIYLYGLDLTDDAGNPLPDTSYQHYIQAAVASLSRQLDIDLIPQTYTDECHDFYRNDYNQFMFLQVDNAPVISVSSVKMYMPGDVLVREFDSSWIRVQNRSGQINIVPSGTDSGTTYLGAGSWYPVFYKSNRFIPDTFRVTYTAGLSPIPADVKDTVGKIASFGPLNIAGDLLGGAGIASQSISLDGLSQSFNTTSSSTSAGYGARLLIYQRDLKSTIPDLKRYYKSINTVVI